LSLLVIEIIICDSKVGDFEITMRKFFRQLLILRLVNNIKELLLKSRQR
jgi:hypothetical protein